MSEYELIMMHNRLEGGKRFKAQRCELILSVPCGYLKLPTGEVILDPDEEARSIVQLVFDKFDELGSFGRLYRYLVRNKIRLGMRVQRGSRRGQLEWRGPRWPRSLERSTTRSTPEPIPMGVAAWITNNRLRVAPRSRYARCRCQSGRCSKRIDCRLTSRGTATWPTKSAFSRIVTSPAQSEHLVSARQLLAGVMVCGNCGRRMHATYRSKSTAYYVCMRKHTEGSDCRGLASAAIDELVTKQVLLALEPAALELSLKAIETVQRERQRLSRHWEQRLERASYEVERAERQYQAVEPENRLVARGLEQKWEAAATCTTRIAGRI